MTDEIILIKEWKTPATDYPEIEFGSARIRREKYTKGYYHNYGLRGYEYFEVKKPIDITCLEIKDEQGYGKHGWSMIVPTGGLCKNMRKIVLEEY